MRKNKIMVCLIIPHYANMFSTFYTLEIIKEVSQAAITQGVDLLIETSWKVPTSSGILFADKMNNERWIKKARQKKIPFLLLNYFDPQSKDNCIGIDNQKATQEVVRYLIKCGHKRIAMITGKLNAQAGRDRLGSFKKTLKQAKIKLDKRYLIKGDWSEDSGRKAMQRLLALKRLPTAVFASGDEMAIGALKAARAAGKRVPQDISLIGFDNIPQTAFPQISLTTVEQPFAELARLGLKKLVQMIKKKPAKPIKMILSNTKLIKRSSVKVLRT